MHNSQERSSFYWLWLKLWDSFSGPSPEYCWRILLGISPRDKNTKKTHLNRIQNATQPYSKTHPTVSWTNTQPYSKVSYFLRKLMILPPACAPKRRVSGILLDGEKMLCFCCQNHHPTVFGQPYSGDSRIKPEGS